MIIANITKFDNNIEFYSPLLIVFSSGLLFCLLYSFTCRTSEIRNRESNNSSPTNSPTSSPTSSRINSPIHSNRLEKIEKNTNVDDDELPSYSDLFNK